MKCAQLLGNSNLGFILLLLLSAGALPSSAAANRIADVGISADNEEVVVEVSTTQPLSRPRLSVGTSHIRMWIPNVDEDSRLELKGDGAVISRVRIRPGAADSSLVTIHLMQGVVIDKASPRIQVEGSRVTLTIPVPVKPVAAAATPIGAGVNALDSKGTNGSYVESNDQVSEGVTSEKRATKPLSWAKSPVDDHGSLLPVPTDSPLSAMAKGSVASRFGYGLLVFIASAGAVLAWLKKFHKGGALAAKTDITVLGARKLGPKHQLVLVRALGEDHLLSMNGDHTERLASAPCPEPDRDSDLDLGISQRSVSSPMPPGISPPPPPSVLDKDPSNDLITATFQRHDTVRLGPDPEPSEGSQPRLRVAGEGPFGAELMSMMTKRIAASESIHARSEGLSRRRTSSSVDGLLKLREEAG